MLGFCEETACLAVQGTLFEPATTEQDGYQVPKVHRMAHQKVAKSLHSAWMISCTLRQQPGHVVQFVKPWGSASYDLPTA